MMVVTDLTAALRPATRPRRPPARGPDRLSLMLFGLAAFLIVLTLLAIELRDAPVHHPAPVVLVRRVYRTTVIETRIGPGRVTAPSVSQSVSSSGAAGAAPAPTTRTS